VEDSQVMGALQATLFNDVLRTNKIRFERTTTRIIPTPRNRLICSA